MKLQAVKIMQLKMIRILRLLKFQSIWPFLFSYPKGIPPQIKNVSNKFYICSWKIQHLYVKHICNLCNNTAQM